MRLKPLTQLLMASVLAAGTCYYYFGLLLPHSLKVEHANNISTPDSYGEDFYPIWLTGRALLFQQENPYTKDMTRKIQIGLYGRPMNPSRPTDQDPDYRAFAYPLFTDWLAAPLLPWRFDVVRVVLSVLLVPLTACSVLLWLRILHIQASSSTAAILMILAVANYPVLIGLYVEQVGLFVAAGLALSIAALTRHRLALAGALLALSSIKPQMVWLLAIYLILWSLKDWRERRTVVLGFLLTILLLCLMSEVLLPGWLLSWWRTVVRYPAYTLPPLPQFVLGKILGSLVMVAALVMAGVVGWKSLRADVLSRELSFALSFILAVSVLLHPSAGAAYDQVVLLPGVLWLWSHRARILNGTLPLRVMGVAAIVALSWQWITSSAIVALSLVAPALALGHWLLLLPTRMAASLPFVVIALLSVFSREVYPSLAYAAPQSLPGKSGLPFERSV
jgi:hypothetical protein